MFFKCPTSPLISYHKFKKFCLLFLILVTNWNYYSKQFFFFLWKWKNTSLKRALLYTNYILFKQKYLLFSCKYATLNLDYELRYIMDKYNFIEWSVTNVTNTYTVLYCFWNLCLRKCRNKIWKCKWIIVFIEPMFIIERYKNIYAIDHFEL